MSEFLTHAILKGNLGTNLSHEMIHSYSQNLFLFLINYVMSYGQITAVNNYFINATSRMSIPSVDS